MAGYQEIVASKRTHREKAIESAHPYVAQTHSEFLNATGVFKAATCVFVFQKIYTNSSYLASEIVSNIGNGRWTASQVVDAYIARAAYAHQSTNCLTEGK